MNSYNNNNPIFEPVNSLPPGGRVTEVRREWLVRTDEALAHRLQDEEITTHLCGNRHRNTQIREDFPQALSQQKQIEQQARHRQMMLENQAHADALIARQVASRLNINQQEKLKQRRRIASDDFSLAMQLQSTSQAPPPLYREYDNGNQPHYFEEIDDVSLAVQAEAIGLPLPEEQAQECTSSTSYSRPQTSKQKKKINLEPVSSLDEDLDIEALGLSKEEIRQMKKKLLQEEQDAELARAISSCDDPGSDALLLADMRCAVEAQDSELARLLQERENQRARRAKEKAKQKALARRLQRAAAAMSEGDAVRPNMTDEYSDPRDLISGIQKKQTSKSMESDINYIEPYENEIIEARANAINSRESSKEWMAQLSHSKRSVPSTTNDPGCSASGCPQVPHDMRSYDSSASVQPPNIAKMIDPTYEDGQANINQGFHNPVETEPHDINVFAGSWRNGPNWSSPQTAAKPPKGKGKKSKKPEKHGGCRTQ